MDIAFVCYQGSGKFSLIEEENTLLLEYLQARGLQVRKEIWDDPEVDWAAYDWVLLKAPWDYFDKYEAFLHWLNRLDQLEVPLLNPSAIVRWNSDKHYLKDIEAAGLPLIPFELLEKGEKVSLEKYFDHFATEQLIVKPAVSGGAKNTFSFNRKEAEELSGRLNLLLEQEAFLVQPFISQIQEEGEWSLVFFNGQFSHCLLKRAKSGDFRVQHVHGGSVHPQTAPEALLEQAKRYIAAFARDCLYARVDGVQINGTFCLMELELIEPFLYLAGSPGSYENYYQALQTLTRRVSETVE
ncbi:ATP-grasp domain-containing protein [Nafulsella turpanensis]|uniref:ATP-grasp domain-containing protein n=1 Tax=Nafulsella turpanensis TaxID=1265690 RepID=UPI00037C45C2|nr:hypothetical protein [Nafulsella turpanensis]